jgi:hypothetical protein
MKLSLDALDRALESLTDQPADLVQELRRIAPAALAALAVLDAEHGEDTAGIQTAVPFEGPDGARYTIRRGGRRIMVTGTPWGMRARIKCIDEGCEITKLRSVPAPPVQLQPSR